MTEAPAAVPAAATEPVPSAAATTSLVVAVADELEARWAAALDFAGAAVSPLFFHAPGLRVEPSPPNPSPRPSPATGEGATALPNPSPRPSPATGEGATALPNPSPRPSPATGEGATALPNPSPRPSPATGEGAAALPPRCTEIAHRRRSGDGGEDGAALPLPDFAQIVQELDGERPDACLVAGESPLARLVGVAADLLGIPLFSLVTGEDQLANLGRRDKRRPDLFFLADARLFAAALADPRYGSTLLPTGHPARDLGEEEFADACYGDGKAGERILAAVDAWRRGALDPATPDLSVIVPAYREAENLPLVCSRLLEAFEGQPIVPEVLMVDDASPDDTYAVALEQMWLSPRIRALTKPLPRGMGNAIRHGLQKARAEVVAVTMGDGSDEVAKLPEMYARVASGEAALAIGSRYRHRANYQTVPRIYRFWSFCFRMTTRVLVGLKLQDYTNAFRVYRRDVFARYGPESAGFEISPESTFKAWFTTRKVAEVDVRHLKRASGQSSFSFLRAGPGYGKVLLKAFVARLTGRWLTIEW
jgi:dolichol-phosphate mannosyltransferase